MPISINNTTLTFNDATTQTTAGGPYVGMRAQTFTSSGTFTIPTGVTALKITVCGGGGGSGGNQGGSGGGGSGGGGGAGVQYFTSLTPGNTLTVTVGGAGAAGNAGQNNGGTGGTSSVASGTQSITTLSATGGGGGAFNVGANAGKGANGTPSNSAYPLVGISAQGNNFSGGTPFGLAKTIGDNPSAGNLYGGGAAGYINGENPIAGSAGAAGIVFIEW
jgi:hypothetical protein